MTTKAFVLLSGGIDSTTCLALAVQRFKAENVTAISIDYNQRHVKEISCARKICDVLGIKKYTMIKGLHGLESMLNDPNAKIPDIKYNEIEGVSPMYVPFRNGQLLSLIAAEAHTEVMRLDEERRSKCSNPHSLEKASGVIYFGAHAEDAANWAYPDCTPEFVGAMANAIYIGTYHQVRLEAPFQYSTKAEIIQRGYVLKVPYELTWSCYKGEELHCGACPTCYARHQAFIDAGVTDPTKYATNPIKG